MVLIEVNIEVVGQIPQEESEIFPVVDNKAMCFPIKRLLNEFPLTSSVLSHQQSLVVEQLLHPAIGP